MIIGILAAGTWTVCRFADTNIQLRYATWEYVSQSGLEIIKLFAPAAVAWFLANLFMKRYKEPIIHCKYRVTLLFTGAMLAGILANGISPLLEYLSFTQHDVMLIKHWRIVVVPICLGASLALGILAGVLYRGRMMLRLLLCILTIMATFLPYKYSLQLSAKLRHDGWISLTEQLDPLIGVLDNFKTHEGKYPNSLDNLVPFYISRLPETKSGTYKTYHYSYIPGLAPSYTLLILSPAGFLEYDELQYSSDGKFPFHPVKPLYWKSIGKWNYHRQWPWLP
jgi:hypothetical protein